MQGTTLILCRNGTLIKKLTSLSSTQKPFADSMFALFVDGDLSKVGISGDFAPLKVHFRSAKVDI